MHLQMCKESIRSLAVSEPLPPAPVSGLWSTCLQGSPPPSPDNLPSPCPTPGAQTGSTWWRSAVQSGAMPWETRWLRWSCSAWRPAAAAARAVGKWNEEAEGKVDVLSLCGTGRRVVMSREHFLLMEQEPFLNIGVFKTDLVIFPVPPHSLALYLPTQERFLCSCTSIWSYCDSKDATVGTIWGYNSSSLAHLSHGVWVRFTSHHMVMLATNSVVGLQSLRQFDLSSRLRYQHNLGFSPHRHCSSSICFQTSSKRWKEESEFLLLGHRFLWDTIDGSTCAGENNTVFSHSKPLSAPFSPQLLFLQLWHWAAPMGTPLWVTMSKVCFKMYILHVC